MIYLIARAAQNVLRISGLIYFGERMTTLRMLNIVLMRWSVLSVFMLCYDSSDLFAAVTREKLVVWVVGTLLLFGLLSQGEERMRASFLAFLMPPPLWPMLPAFSDSSGYTVLPWVRGCGCCTTLHPLFFFLLQEPLRQHSFQGTGQRLLKYARLMPIFKKKYTKELHREFHPPKNKP